LWLVARLRLLLRMPRTTFFSFVFPLILLVFFDSVNRSNVTAAGGTIAFAQFFTPSIAVFALASATYTGLIFGITTARDQGILKRVRGTPLPMSVFLGSWLAATLITGIGAVVLMFVVGVPLFGVHVYPRLLPAGFVTLVLGGATLCTVAVAVSTYVKRPEAAPIAANLTLFPLMIVSGVFFPITTAPAWLQRIAHVFPLSHLTEAFGGCFSPFTRGSGFAVRDLASIAAWGVAGAVVAIRRLASEWEEPPGTS
jgi:ABC-2 type transport system permease protein